MFKELSIIIDSSSLILLAKSNLISTLLDQKKYVFIPEEVYEETILKGIELGYSDAFTLRRLAEGEKIRIVRPKRNFQMKIGKKTNLDSGERDVLALAIEFKRGLVFCDDKKGINACKIFGIQFITSLGFLENIFVKGLISKKDALDKSR